MGRPAPAKLLERITRATAAAGAGPVGSVTVDGIEVVQVVQDMAHSVVLVAGKATIVRVYLSSAIGAIDVRGEIRVGKSASGPWFGVAPIAPAALASARSGSSPAALLTRREDVAYSLNFRLPSSLTGVGEIWIRVAKVRLSSGAQLAVAAHPYTRVRFRRSSPLRLRLVKVRYSTGGQSATHVPSSLDIDLIGSWLRRAYPIASLQLTTTTIDASKPAPFDASEINAQLLALRAADMATGTDRRTHYFGLVADSGGYMRGLASGIPATPTPGTVASGPTGPDSFGWDTDGSYGDWYTGHELGHTFGRYHAEFCGAGGGAPYPFPAGQLANPDGAFVGLDVGDTALGLPMRALPGRQWFDLMTYCQRQWLSSFTYEGIRARLASENALGAGASAGAAGAAGAGPGGAMSGGIHVIASVNVTRASGALRAVLPSTAPPSSEASGAGATATVALTDAGGATLLERVVPLDESVCLLPGDDVTGTIDVVIPLMADARRITLKLGAVVLDERPIGGGASRAGVRRSNEIGLDVRPAGTDAAGDLIVAWAEDAASAGRRYLVQVSVDDGKTWRAIGIDLTDPSVRIDPDDFPGRTDIRVRVLVTDGLEQTAFAEGRVALGGV